MPAVTLPAAPRPNGASYTLPPPAQRPAIPDTTATLLKDAHAHRMAAALQAHRRHDDETCAGHLIHARAIRDDLRTGGHEGTARFLDGVAGEFLPVREAA